MRVLEVVEGGEHDRVAAVHQTHGREQLEHEGARAALAVPQAERDRAERAPVPDDEVEAVLVVHDGAQAAHTLVHVLLRRAHVQPEHALARVLVGAGGAPLQRRGRQNGRLLFEGEGARAR